MSKIDRLVAERVMGWTVRESEPDDNDYERYINGWAVSRWNPSTDIAAAWGVVEHLRTRKDDPMVITMLDNDDGEYVIAFATRADRWTTREIGKHRDAPLAICLAALRSVGVPESEIQEAMR